MKIAAISDTHGDFDWTVPECDVFIHAGDLTAGGSVEESLLAMGYCIGAARLANARNTIIVPGNHDAGFEKAMPYLREQLRMRGMNNVHILVNQRVVIESKTFWGSPYTPPFMDWHFMADESQLWQMYAGMPEAVDVLVTHGPATHVLDRTLEGKPAGSEALREAIAIRYVPHHVFGHIHEQGGKQDVRNGTTSYNVSAMDRGMKIRRGCRVFDI